MTGFNHAITGSIIAVVIKNPALALPLAFASHFVLDTLPHFGYAGHGGYGAALKKKLSFVVVALDPIFYVILLGTLLHYSVGWSVYAASVAAIAPDFEWPFAYFLFERKGKKPPRSPIANFHIRIQWCERPWGLAVEFAWFAIAWFVLISLLR